MKGYMMDETAKARIERYRKNVKGVATAERMEKILLNLQLDGHLIEVPTESEMYMKAFINDYREEGWTLLTIPDSEIEGKLLARALEASGRRLKWDGE
jgi:hypothetical protein